MFGTKSLRSGGTLLAASLLVALALPAPPALADHAQARRHEEPKGGGTAPGVDGFPDFPNPAIGPFPDTTGMKLLSQLLPADIGVNDPVGGVFLNDIWGWTSPRGEEYALVGTANGLSIVRVTDPSEPEFMGQVETNEPGAFGNLWGDAAVYNVKRRSYRSDDDDDDDEGVRDRFIGYVYFTNEASNAGINILQLNKLDDMDAAPDPSFKIAPDATFASGGYDAAHNIYINQDSGFAYLAGVSLTGDETACDNEPFHPARFNTMILDLKGDPLNPEVAACLADAGEHDFYVVNYRGPDRDYRGREIAFVFDGRDRDARTGTRPDSTPGRIEGGMTEIWDVTDKDNIEVISAFLPEGLCFSHAGWTSSNRHEFLLINDEIDEIRDSEPNDGTGFFRTNFCASDEPQVVPNPSLYVVNIRDLDNPFLQERFFLDSPGDNDHNFVRKRNKLYWAVYNAGTHVLQMRKRRGKLELREVGELDSEPRQPPFFNGQWGVFPFPKSSTIVASDIVNGLIIMRLDRRDRDDDDDDRDRRMTFNVDPAAAMAAKAAARDALVEFLKSTMR